MLAGHEDRQRARLAHLDEAAAWPRIAAGDVRAALLERRGRWPLLPSTATMRGAIELPGSGWTKTPKSVEDLPCVRFLGATVTEVAVTSPGAATFPTAVPDRVRRRSSHSVAAGLRAVRTRAGCRAERFRHMDDPP